MQLRCFYLVLDTTQHLVTLQVVKSVVQVSLQVNWLFSSCLSLFISEAIDIAPFICSFTWINRFERCQFYQYEGSPRYIYNYAPTGSTLLLETYRKNQLLSCLQSLEYPLASQQLWKFVFCMFLLHSSEQLACISAMIYSLLMVLHRYTMMGLEIILEYKQYLSVC